MRDLNELQMLAEQDPALRQALSELFATGDMQKFQADLLANARAEKATEQPGLIHSRDMNVAASPLANIASTMKQIHGGQQAGAIQQAMADLINKKSQTADKYNAYIQQMAQRQQAEAAAKAQQAQAANPNRPGMGLGPADIAQPTPFKMPWE